MRSTSVPTAVGRSGGSRTASRDGGAARAAEGDHDFRVAGPEPAGDLDGWRTVPRNDDADDGCCGATGRGHPVVDGQVRPEIGDRMAGAPHRHGEGEGAELVAAARRQPDDDPGAGPAGAARGLEGQPEPPEDGVAGEVLAGDAHHSRRPGITEALQGREHEVGHDALERAAREHLVERRPDPIRIQGSRRLDQARAAARVPHPPRSQQQAGPLPASRRGLPSRRPRRPPRSRRRRCLATSRPRPVPASPGRARRSRRRRVDSPTGCDPAGRCRTCAPTPAGPGRSPRRARRPA